MPRKTALKMKTAIEHIAADDVKGLDIKKMQGRDAYRVRVGNYRAIYSIDMVILHVEAIAHRQGIYE